MPKTKKPTRKAASAKSAAPSIPVVIYTRTRSIYFGRVADPTQRPVLEVHGFRHVYYCNVQSGNHSLQVAGPGPQSRLTPECPMPVYVEDIANVAVCTEQAAEAFRKAGWSR